jgi:hypothetical protein
MLSRQYSSIGEKQDGKTAPRSLLLSAAPPSHLPSEKQGVGRLRISTFYY